MFVFSDDALSFPLFCYFRACSKTLSYSIIFPFFFTQSPAICYKDHFIASIFSLTIAYAFGREALRAIESIVVRNINKYSSIIETTAIFDGKVQVLKHLPKRNLSGHLCLKVLDIFLLPSLSISIFIVFIAFLHIFASDLLLT